MEQEDLERLGCVLKHSMQLWPGSGQGEWRQAAASLRRPWQLAPDTLAPHHGQPLGSQSSKSTLTMSKVLSLVL